MSAVTFHCAEVRAAVSARDGTGAWRSLGITSDGPVQIPDGVTDWSVTAYDPDDAGLAALARAVAGTRAPALVVSCGRLSPDGLRPMRELGHLRRLGLRAVASHAVDGVRDPRLTSRELGWLYDLTGLESLALEGGTLRLRSVLKLARRMPRLASLTLTGCLPDDEGLEALAELPALDALAVHGPSEYGEHADWLRDAGLARLARVPRLERLDLWCCKGITDAGVAALGPHPALRDVTLGDPDHSWSPGEGALVALARLPSLRAVALHGCGRTLTLAALRHLDPLPLAGFALEACHLTPDALAWLRERFPGLDAGERAITSHLRWRAT